MALTPWLLSLTYRERDVLLWSAYGKTTDEIADILNISSTTVNSYVRDAITKLDATSRTHAVAKVFISAFYCRENDRGASLFQITRGRVHAKRNVRSLPDTRSLSAIVSSGRIPRTL